jgi:DNA-binding NarL/FixJ family response regulator
MNIVDLKVDALMRVDAWQVVIVDDDVRVRTYLKERINAHPNLILCATLSGRQEALTWIDQYRGHVDALLCDLYLPDGSGLDVIEATHKSMPSCDAMVISTHGDERNVLASIRAGAVGYLYKDAGLQDVAQAIMDMKAGAVPLSPMIARGLLSQFRSLNPSGKSMRCDSPLTPREAAILDLIARGFAYAEIASLEKLTIHTVKTHIKKLYRKLEVHSKSEAVFEASRLGWIKGFT